MFVTVYVSVELAGERGGAGAGEGWREGPGGQREAALGMRGGQVAGEAEEGVAKGCTRACEGAVGRWRLAAFGLG